jgi:hypothetical protein
VGLRVERHVYFLNCDRWLLVYHFFFKKKKGGRYVVHSFDKKKKNMVRSMGLASGPHSLGQLLARGQRFARFFFLLVFLYSKKTLTGLIYFLVLTWFLNTIINFYFCFNSFLFNYYVFDNNNNNKLYMKTWLKLVAYYSNV